MSRPTATPRVTYPPAGYCIYCGPDKTDVGRLDKEHIIPDMLAGRLVIPEASCAACAKITGGFEGRVANTIYGANRAILGLRPRRKPQKWKSGPLPIEVIYSGKPRFIKTSPELYPIIVPSFEFKGFPPITLEPPPDKISYDLHMNYFDDEDRLDMKIRFLGSPIRIRADVDAYLRMCFKIAYCFTWTQIGNNYDCLILDNILSTVPKRGPLHFIGGDNPHFSNMRSRHLHKLWLSSITTSKETFICVRLQLFAFYGHAAHYIVVGRSNGATRLPKSPLLTRVAT